MKRILSTIAVLLTVTILSGSGNKAAVWKYELPLSFYGEFDSIPTINQFGQVRNGIIVDNIISVYNADPNGVDLTNTQIEAFRMLVGGMYTTGTWQKCKAIYPFIGGSEYKHKWNIKDLRDLDAAFRLQYLGTVLHDSNGINSQTGGYADTKLIPSAVITNINNSSLGFYITNAPTPENFVDMGVSNGSDIRFALRAAFDNGSNRTASGSIGQDNPLSDSYSTSLVTGKAMLIASRQSNVINKIFVNGRLEGITTVANTGTLPTNSVALLAAPGTTYVSKRTLGFAFVANTGLTDTEAIRMSNIVTFAQGILNRQ